MALPEEKSYTLADILAREGEEYLEIIDGVLTMINAQLRIHQEVSAALFCQLHNYMKDKKPEVYIPIAVRLFERDGDRPEDVRTMVMPDISVVCDPKKLDDIGCKGAPDFIIEILSPSTQRHDRLTKFNLYRQAGVREYWIVDPAGKSIQTFVLEDGHYTAKDFGEAGDKLRVSILEDCIVDLSAVFPE